MLIGLLYLRFYQYSPSAVMCGAECESVVHVFWECPANSSSRLIFLGKLQGILGERYTEFNLLSNLDKTAYIGSEMWKYLQVH